jgi:acetyl-CoA carboxylase carboxyltransferase component
MEDWAVQEFIENNGNAHFFAESEAECFEQIKKLVSFISTSND